MCGRIYSYISYLKNSSNVYTFLISLTYDSYLNCRRIYIKIMIFLFSQIREVAVDAQRVADSQHQQTFGFGEASLDSGLYIIRDFDFIFNVPLQEGIDWRRVGKTARLFHGIAWLKQFVWKILTKIISYVTMIMARCFVLSEIKVAIFI